MKWSSFSYCCMIIAIFSLCSRVKCFIAENMPIKGAGKRGRKRGRGPIFGGRERSLGAVVSAVKACGYLATLVSISWQSSFNTTAHSIQYFPQNRETLMVTHHRNSNSWGHWLIANIVELRKLWSSSHCEAADNVDFSWNLFQCPGYSGEIST